MQKGGYFKLVRWEMNPGAAKNAKKVNEYDYYTGKFIRQFESMEEARLFHDIKHENLRKAIKRGGKMPRKKLWFKWEDK